MNKHLVILPDGVKATRNSQNNVYTHAIQMGPEPRESTIGFIQRRIVSEQELIVRYQEALNYLTNGGEIVALPNWGGFKFHMSGLKKQGYSINDQTHGKSILTPNTMTADQTELAREMGIEQNKGYIKNCERTIERLTKEIADLEAGPAFIGGWGIVTWCGRYDLAQKQLNKYSQPGRDVRIVEVERVGA
jgi:hypothetical protein